jgi:two-component system cell cycle sensor histidine kinase/response regulator CckA
MVADERSAALERENAALRAELEQLRGSLYPGESPALTRLLGDRALLAQLPDIIMVLDRDHRILYVNRTAPGRTPEELIGQSLLEQLPPQLREERRAVLDNVWKTGEAIRTETPSLGGFWWETRIVPIRENGRIVLLLTTAVDCTVRKKAELSLLENERHLRHAAEATGMGTWTAAAGGSGITWDERLCELYGVGGDQVPKDLDDFLGFVHPEDHAAFLDSLQTLRVHGASDMRYRIVRPDGAIRYLLAKGSLQYDDRGNVIGALGGVFDMTHQKLLEDQVGQVQKLEAIGQLTAGIAHNFNNVLGIILPNAELLQRDRGTAHDARIDAILHAGRRGAEMIRQLMVFARRDGSAKRVPVDVAASLSRTADICRTTFDRSIAIELQTSPSLPYALANSGQLEQVLLNICLNARDALSEPPAKDPRITIVATPGLEGSLRIRVSDNGHGMDAATRARIFNPFFTTKEVQRGTGLGLATVFAIIADHHGTITCESSVGRGTTFEITLPGTLTEGAPPEDPRVHSFREGSGLILLIDDEPLVRSALSAVLDLAGYEVLEAPDGATGVAVFEARRHELAAVILDRSMPGMSGVEALALMRAVDAQMPIILLSGDPGAASSMARVTAVLMKPTPSGILLETLHEVIEAAKPAR